MNFSKKIETKIASLEARVSKMRRSSAQTESRIEQKLAHIVDYAETQADNATKLRIQRRLAKLELGMESDIFPSLTEVEKEVDSIYGDQSKNDTYYFARKRSAAFLKDGADVDVPWHKLPLEEVEEVIELLYGDQSKNETFYTQSALISRAQSLLNQALRKASDGYFKQDDFMDHNPDIGWNGGYRVDTEVETFGYHGDEIDEAPHIHSSVFGDSLNQWD